MVIGTAAFFVAASLAGCAENAPNAGSKTPSLTVNASASSRVPDSTLDELVSFGDHLVVAKITKDAVVPASKADEEHGEGLIGREVTVAVEQVLWSRKNAPKAPTTFTTADSGWAFGSGTTVPMLIDGDSHYTPGKRYLMVLTQFPEGWAWIGPQMPVSSSKIQIAGPESPDVKALSGKTNAEVAAEFKATAPISLVAANDKLGPDERWNLLAAERAKAAPTTTRGG